VSQGRLTVTLERSDSDLIVASRLAIAALVGLGAGLEREWSGHASGPDARFAGIRTFTLLGLIGGIAGALAIESHGGVATALVGLAGALCVAGYVVATRRPAATTDGTTEAAALAVIALGVVAGMGDMGLAAGVGAIVVLLLREKERVHWLVGKLEEPELRAGVQFVVLAIVVLPLLPDGPFLGPLAIRPRSLWAIVLLFSGLNFAGFIARRTVGANTGMAIAGALGGVISSTAVTLNFSRQSRDELPSNASLAAGVLAACTVLVPRVLLVSAVLNPGVALHLLPALAPMFLVGVILVAIAWRGNGRNEAPAPGALEESPLHLAAAIRMALLFQVAIVAIAYVRRFGEGAGLYSTAAILGLTDVDALTVSLSRPVDPIAPAEAARAILIGIVANTVLKLSIAALIGRAAFRRKTIAGLACLALGGVVGVLVT
jgi:uncharacterized membrane protein (DUF4010 family)